MVDNDTLITKGYDFEVVGKGKVENGEVVITQNGSNILADFSVSEEHVDMLKQYLTSMPELEDYTVIFRFGYDKAKVDAVREGSAEIEYASFNGNIEVFEVQDNNELWTFILIFAFAGSFGLLLLLFLKKLKKLAHGAEDIKL
jgi:POT family proton-dependent oligopeptide transporter